jgi:hypothetical protein
MCLAVFTLARIFSHWVEDPGREAGMSLPARGWVWASGPSKQIGTACPGARLHGCFQRKRATDIRDRDRGSQHLWIPRGPRVTQTDRLIAVRCATRARSFLQGGEPRLGAAYRSCVGRGLRMRIPLSTLGRPLVEAKGFYVRPLPARNGAPPRGVRSGLAVDPDAAPPPRLGVKATGLAGASAGPCQTH